MGMYVTASPAPTLSRFQREVFAKKARSPGFHAILPGEFLRGGRERHVVFTTIAIRDRRRIVALMAPIFLATGITDVILFGGLAPEPLILRLIWAAVFLAVAWIMPRLEPERLDHVVTLTALICALFWYRLAWLTGGTSSPYFYLTPALPLVYAVLAPDNPTASLGAAAAILAGGVLLFWLEGAAAGAIVVYLVIASLMCGLAVVGTLVYRRLRHAELAIAQAHERALEELAISENRRLKAEKLALIGRLSSRIAHELNNPLAFVKSNIDFLDAAPACTCHDTIGPVIEDSLIGIDRIEKIVSALDSFARMDDATTEACDLSDMVAEAAKLANLRTRTVARLRIDVPRDLPPVQANAAQLVQVLVILLLNAADSMVENHITMGNIDIRGSSQGDKLTITVENDGPGIAAEIRPYIFEPFFTTKLLGKGTGLGLALAREYLQRIDATITLDDSTGGPCFRLILPVAAMRSAPMDDRPPSHAAA